jgi:site-specific DNA recombinase
MTTAAIYARVSGARQKEEQTIGSQIAECRQAAESWGLDLVEDWVFTDEGYTGASLVRPALERLRDLAAQVPVEVVICYSPDRLARKLAYQTLLIDEFNKAGSEVRFVKARKVETPEDEMLLQFQGMMAEYERALIIERTRRGKAFRARAGMVNVLGGAPYGFCYVRRTDVSEARYEIVEDEAQVVREVFRRYTDEQASIGELARWLTGDGIPTRTGKDHWDRSVIWAMLRNPAYVGRAAFLKTGTTDRRPAINRQARLQGRTISRHYANYERPKEEWIIIPVPAIIDQATFELAERRLADNRRFAARNSKQPSLLMGLAACQCCGYAYYRTSTRTAKRKIYYYRCLGSDDYRYPGGRVCDNKPVRADYLDDVVWHHVTALLADPALVQAELDRRLTDMRATNPATSERARLERDLTRATKAISRLVQAYQEDLLTLDELRARMPDLRAKQTTLQASIDSLDAQLLDQETYLKLAETLDSFLTRLRETTETATVEDRQKVLRSVVKEVLVGPERVVIRHSIPVRDHPFLSPGYPLRWGSHNPTLGNAGHRVPLHLVLSEDPGFEERFHQRQDTLVPDSVPQPVHETDMRDFIEARFDVSFQDPLIGVSGIEEDLLDGVLGAASRAETVTARLEVRLENRLQHQFQSGLHSSVACGGDDAFILPPCSWTVWFGIVRQA